MKKSSDNPHQPRRLEEVFRDGFEPAEVKPDGHLWTRIEQELESKQAHYYKTRLAWYRSVAAASVLLLTFAIGYLWYDNQMVHRPDASAAKVDLAAQNQVAVTSPTGPNIPAPIAEDLPAPRSLKVQPTTIAARDSRTNRRSPESLAQLNPAAKMTGDANINANIPLNQNQPTAAESNNPTTISLAETPALAAESASPLLPDSMSLPVQTLAEKSVGTTLPVLAATEPASQNQMARWSLGGGTGSQYFDQNVKFNTATNSSLNLSPAYSFNNMAAISKNYGGNTLTAAMREFNENTRPAFSYRAAVAGNYRLNNAWSLEAGITFVENKAQTVTTYIINKPALARNYLESNSGNFLDNNTADKSLANNVTIPVTVFVAELTGGYLNSNVTVDKVAPFNVYYRYRQVGVPLKIRYQQGRGNWFTFVQAGGAVNVLLQTSILSDSPQVPDIEYTLGKTSPFRQWYFTALGSVGRGLKVSDTWQVQGSLDVARNFSTLTTADMQPNTSQQKPFYVGFGISSSFLIRPK